MAESSDKSSSAKKASNVPADVERAPAPPMVLINSPWLAAVTSRIRSRPIPWEGYARADLVSQDELKMIRSVDGKDHKAAEKVLDERGEEYAVLFLRLLGKLSRTDTLQQVLVLVGDMLDGRDDRVDLFFKAAKKAKGGDKGKGEEGSWPWAPLIKLLDIPDDFAQLKAAHFLTLLLVAPTTSATSTLTTAPTSVITRLLTFLSKLINSTTSNGEPSSPSAGSGLLHPPTSGDTYADGNGADIAIQLLESLLRTQQFRREVWKDEMRRQSETPTTEEKEVKKGKDDGDKENKGSDDGEGETQKKTIKHGQSPGLIRGLVYILQAALVAPQGSSSSPTPANDDSEENSQGSSSRNGASTPSSAKSSPVTPQMQYQVIFCFWLLSFSDSIAEEINRKFSIVPLLVDVARGAVKEKVIRITIATLKNLLFKAPNENAPVMLGSKLLPLVEILSERKWSDEEIEEDLKYLSGELEERLKGMSTYDEYLSELSSGKLSWDNPAHELDDFWKANAHKLLEASSSSSTSEEASSDNKKDDEDEGEEDDASPRTGLLRLIWLLKTSSDPQTLSVALHDIGKVIQFTEAGRRRVNESKGGKAEIMKLISHQDSNVKFRALNTVGKLMSESWR